MSRQCQTGVIMNKRIAISLLVLLPFMLFFTDSISGAQKLSFVQNLLRHSDDVAKLGKRVEKITISQMDDIAKRFPALAGKSKDLLRGAAAIEQTAQKSPAAARLIDNGLNPARIAITAERHPERIMLGNEIADMFAKAKPTQTGVNLPAQAASAARSLDGNYVKAAENFFEMARKGGKGAVTVAEKLYKAATPGKVAAATAMALLAWHMADPQGAEEAIQNFFRDHVEPVVQAPLQGMIEGAGNSLDKTLDTTTEQLGIFAEKHWPWILIGIFVFLFVSVPNLRRLPFAIINNYCGNLLNRIQKSEDVGESPTNKRSARGADARSIQRINIYNRK